MKYLQGFISVRVLGFTESFAQNTNAQQPDTTMYDVVIKNDGTEFVGTIISSDAREVHIVTKTVGEVIIPKHEIREIKRISVRELDNIGGYIGEEVFATRYFLTTNGLPVAKGESYVQWNLFGPDLQFGVSDNFGLGVMTSWIGIPLIGTAKYSFHRVEMQVWRRGHFWEQLRGLIQIRLVHCHLQPLHLAIERQTSIFPVVMGRCYSMAIRGRLL